MVLQGKRHYVADDNPLNCIVSKVKITEVAANMDLEAKQRNIPPCDLYYDMKYTLPHLTFSNIKMKEIEGIVMHHQLFQVKLAQTVQLGSLKFVCWTCILAVEPCLLVYALAHPYLESN